MKQLKSWKFLFGLATAITVGLASMLLFRANSDRNKLRSITGKLVQSIELAQDNNQNMQLAIDSLTDRLQQTNSIVERFEAQKDSLIKGIPRSRQKSPQVTSIQSYPAENENVLFMNCLNTLDLIIPPSYKNKGLTYTAKGADISKTEVVGQVHIVPKERVVEVSVLSDGKIIKVETFQVKPIPKPLFIVRDNNMNEINLTVGVSAALARSLRVTAEADKTFKRAVPKDGSYKIKNMEVTWDRGRQSLGRILFNATEKDIIPDVDLSLWKLVPGDKIVIDIRHLARKTYLGYEERVDVVGGVITIPVNSGGASPTTSTSNSNEEATVTEPTFTVVRADGEIIDPQKGIKGGLLYSIKVLAGSPFRVREMELIISRGSSRIATINANGSTPDISSWRSMFAPGDRLTIIIKRVLKKTPNGDREAGFNNGVIIIPIL